MHDQPLALPCFAHANEAVTRKTARPLLQQEFCETGNRAAPLRQGASAGWKRPGCTPRLMAPCCVKDALTRPRSGRGQGHRTVPRFGSFGHRTTEVTIPELHAAVRRLLRQWRRMQLTRKRCGNKSGRSLHALPCGKAPGPDGRCCEMPTATAQKFLPTLGDLLCKVGAVAKVRNSWR